MKGVDGEIGVRVPIFSEGLNLDLRAYAGGYHFWADGVDDITGPRARLELTAHDVGGLPGVRLTGGLTYQYDDARGDQLIAGARLRIPLQTPSVSSSGGLDYMDRRMTNAVVRDVDIVSNTRRQRSVTTSVSVLDEEAINSWNGETITSFAQVDGSVGLAAFQDLLDAAGAGALIVANGDLTFSGNTGLHLGAQQTLMGGGSTLWLHGATTGVDVEFSAPGSSGTITNTAGAYTHVVNMADSSVLSGMTIHASAPPASNALAVGAAGVDGAWIVDNNITATGNNSHGVKALSGSSDIVINRNTIEVNGGAVGLGVQINEASAIVSGNFISTSGISNVGAIRLYDATVLSGSDRNTVVDGPSCSLVGPASTGSVSFTNAPDCGS